MENSVTDSKTPTFIIHPQEKPKTHQISFMGNSKFESLSNFRENPPTRKPKRRKLDKNKIDEDFNEEEEEKNGDVEDEDEDDEDTKPEEIEKKVMALQKIVPGGESLGVDKLFEETAEYILALQSQIKVMRFVADLIQGLEREKRKIGG